MRILRRALEICTGPRRKTYGHPAENHERTATMWRAYLQGRARANMADLSLPPDVHDAILAVLPRLLDVDGRDVCWLNTFQKGSRDAHHRQEDNLVAIVPIDKALDANPSLIDDPDKTIEIGDIVVTRLFELQYVEVASIVKLLQNMKLGVAVSTIENSQMLFVTCYASRMSRIEQLVGMLDRPGTVRECRFRRLQYVTASFLVGKIRTLANELQEISIATATTTTDSSRRLAP